MIGVVAKLKIKEGQTEKAIEMFKELMANVAKEEGTLMYTLNREKSDPNTLVIMERYKDDAALAAHSSSPYFKEFSKKSGGLMAGKPEITVVEQIDSI
jgi:quinol monooxygenase YgiN